MSPDNPTPAVPELYRIDQINGRSKTSPTDYYTPSLAQAQDLVRALELAFNKQFDIVRVRYINGKWETQ